LGRTVPRTSCRAPRRGWVRRRRRSPLASASRARRGRGTTEPVPRNALAVQRRAGPGPNPGTPPGTTDGELDLLVDLPGQAPGLGLRPHEVRFLSESCCGPYQARAGASLSASTGQVNSSIVRLGISTRGACGAGGGGLTQPSQIAAYPWEGVAVYEARVA